MLFRSIVPGLRITAEAASTDPAERNVVCVATSTLQSAGGALGAPAELQRSFQRRLGAFLHRNRSRTDRTLRLYLDHPLLEHVLGSERVVLADVAQGHTFRVQRVQSVDDTDEHTLLCVCLRSPQGGATLVSTQIYADSVLTECVQHVHTAIRRYVAEA